jgi:methionyl-tRNA formyltransferase
MWVALCFCSIRGVDTGDIVAQERIPVEKGDSFMTLSWKGMIRIAQLQAAALGNPGPGTVAAAPRNHFDCPWFRVR